MTRPVAFYCQSVYNPGSGGAQRIMITIANELSKRGYDVDILCNGPHPILDKVDSSVRIVDIGKFKYHCIRALNQYVRREKPHALVSSEFQMSLSGLVVKHLNPGMKMIVHQAHPFFIDMESNSRKWRMLIALYRRLLPQADVIVHLTPASVDAMTQVIRATRKKSLVRCDPYDIDGIVAKSREPTHHPWLMPHHNTPVICAVSRLDINKDVATILRATQSVAERHSVKLVIVGDGAEADNLRSLATELDINDVVDFVGFADNPYSYMTNSDVFVAASWYEGLLGTLVEALACGTNIVSTDCPHGPAHVLKGGELGRLVPMRDPQAMAQAIMDALDDPIEPEILRSSAYRFDMRPAIDGWAQILGL